MTGTVKRLLLALAPTLALALAVGAPGVAAAAPPAGPQSSEAADCAAAPGLDPVLADLEGAFGDGVVWMGGSCSAQLTCESNCVKHCTGTVSCSVGPNYVVCDGVYKYCPSCNISQFPGYPPCAWRLCPWCVCVSNGGTPESCCEDV
jgi:hypothetical protein